MRKIKKVYSRWKTYKKQDLIKGSFVRYFIKDYFKKYLLLQHKRLGLFTSTNIETFGYCNRKCSFCFNNEKFPDREVGIMSIDVWQKIVNELSIIKFAGRLAPYFFGEPLLDKRILELISYARKKCPYSFIQINSNGDILKEHFLLSLIKNGLDRIHITNYDDVENNNLLKLSKKYPYHVDYRAWENISLVNRAGKIFDKENRNINKPCMRPSNQLVINWKGNVLLCCQDYYEEYILGNVKDESIQKIWYSVQFQKYRKILKAGNRKAIDICKNCDI